MAVSSLGPFAVFFLAMSLRIQSSPTAKGPLGSTSVSVSAGPSSRRLFRSIHSLPLCFSNRYDKQASVADLEEAIAFGRVALELCPLGHPDRSWNFNHLGYYLRNAFPKLGTTADLDEAFSLHWLALDLRPEDHPSQRALIM